jgi:hypothetical protein
MTNATIVILAIVAACTICKLADLLLKHRREMKRSEAPRPTES